MKNFWALIICAVAIFSCKSKEKLVIKNDSPLEVSINYSGVWNLNYKIISEQCVTMPEIIQLKCEQELDYNFPDKLTIIDFHNGTAIFNTDTDHLMNSVDGNFIGFKKYDQDDKISTACHYLFKLISSNIFNGTIICSKSNKYINRLS